jgi:hypothetical protein
MSSQSPYQQTVTATLDALGWSHMHTRPVFDAKSKRFLTPHTAKGWPDLACVHHRSGVLLFAELKGHHGLKTKTWTTSDVRPDQVEWLHKLHRNPGAACVVFRPDDDWLLVSEWLAKPWLLLSGYGWLPPEQWRGVITGAQVAEILRARTDSALSSYHLHVPD